MGLSEQFEKLVIDQDKDLADGDKVISNVNDIVDRVNGSAVESNGNDKDAVTHLYVKVVDVDDVKIKSADKSQDSKQDVNSTEEDDQDLVASFSKTKI